MQSDFQRTISETELAEEEAEEEKTKYKDDAVDKLDSAEQDLQSQTDVLTTTIPELLELQPVCVDTGMTYEERVAAREEEIKALNKALCILTAYAEFGDGGTGTGSC